jgi:pSer/pThr/pTyr-binding forkhead associated (FHA) protein
MPFPEDEGVTRDQAAAYLLDLGSNRAYALGGRPVGIGRDPVNYVAIREATVSRFHGEVRYDPTAGSFTFHSMGAHGSTVNGKRVSESGLVLSDGDVLGIQGTSLRFTTTRPQPPYRTVARADQVPTSPSTPTPPLPLQRSVEPPTTGLETTDPHSVSSGARWRTAWLIALVAVVIVVGLILLYLRKRHSA